MTNGPDFEAVGSNMAVVDAATAMPSDRVRDQWSDGRRVDFVIAGAQKAGTSAMYHYLSQHPDIVVSDEKELHFFDNEHFFDTDTGHVNKPESYASYHERFPPISPTAVCGEATPVYMWWRPSIQRIQRYNPAMKIICVLRHPVDRAFSQYNMEVARSFEDRPFKVCIEEEDIDGEQHRVRSYLSRGFYVSQIERIYAEFPADQVLCVKYERFRDNDVVLWRRYWNFYRSPVSSFITSRSMSRSTHARWM